MLAKVFSAAIVGLDAVPVEVEVDIASQGLPNFFMVGLPDKRITVNLAPADLPKEGPSYDLPIALGILIASGQLTYDTSHALFSGELSLDGRVRPIIGALLHAMLAKKQQFSSVFLPTENAHEAALVPDVDIYPVTSLKSLFAHLTGDILIQKKETLHFIGDTKKQVFPYDMRDVKGQQRAKRTLEIAAAGAHNILFKGPPGAGKTLLARTLPSILPPLTFDEMLEVTKIYSISGLLNKDTLVKERPFRSPHHTTSLVGLVGGGTIPRPGEITLAHRGVLFLDEFPEFPRIILESLRQPIEDTFVSLSRANGKTTFPANCMLVAAQNPCPCGYLGDKYHTCSCASAQIVRYQKKISGPLLDRIDMHVDVPAIKIEKLTEDTLEVEDSASIRKRVHGARSKQQERYKSLGLQTNAELTTKQIKEYCVLSDDCRGFLRLAVNKFKLSGRSYYRVLKLARTIADLDDQTNIQQRHLAEAIQYRPKIEQTAI